MTQKGDILKHIKKIGEISIAGSIGLAVILALSGCEKKQENTNLQSVKNGAFVVIEEQPDGSYKILEEYPSEVTRVLLKTKDGSERMLSESEINDLIKQEEQKINNNTSELTNPSGAGLGLGGAILASAAGAIIGSYIGNKLFNNQNYQAQQRTTYKSPQAYERSKNSFANASSAARTSTGKSGFFGGGSGDKQRAIGG